MNFFPSSRGVDARCADVILHVACAEHAAGIHVFEAGDDLVRGLAGDVGHHVQAAAVAHGHHGIDATQIARAIEDGIEQRDERGVAFEGETLAAQVAALEDLLE